MNKEEFKEYRNIIDGNLQDENCPDSKDISREFKNMKDYYKKVRSTVRDKNFDINDEEQKKDLELKLEMLKSSLDVNSNGLQNYLIWLEYRFYYEYVMNKYLGIPYSKIIKENKKELKNEKGIIIDNDKLGLIKKFRDRCYSYEIKNKKPKYIRISDFCKLFDFDETSIGKVLHLNYITIYFNYRTGFGKIKVNENMLEE